MRAAPVFVAVLAALVPSLAAAAFEATAEDPRRLGLCASGPAWPGRPETLTLFSASRGPGVLLASTRSEGLPGVDRASLLAWGAVRGLLLTVDLRRLSFATYGEQEAMLSIGRPAAKS